jgi:tRNA C32,U32 (ribose-2'-O)-methylase TrmJ
VCFHTQLVPLHDGLNRPIVEACQCHVALPKWAGRSSSYNVAMAGTLVMYDRMLKQIGAGVAKVGDPAGADEDDDDEDE